MAIDPPDLESGTQRGRFFLRTRTLHPHGFGRSCRRPNPAHWRNTLHPSPSAHHDLETLGFLFESAAVHDLLIYAEALGTHVHHYRDSNGREIDAVLTMPNRHWAAIEMKLGGGQAQRGAESLACAVDQIDAAPPAFKAVITGTGFTATLPDGTITFPLYALRP